VSPLLKLQKPELINVYRCEGNIISIVTYGAVEHGGESYVDMGERLSWILLRAIGGYAVDAIPIRESLI